MASDLSIAIRIEAAINNMEAVTAAIADRFGVASVTIPRNARGGEKMLQALQLEALNEWFSAFAALPASDSIPAQDSAHVIVKSAKKK